MAELREVIIGNISLTISAGPNPSNRGVVAKGEATIYDQNVNATRGYIGDLTTNMTAADRTTFNDLINRLISGIMVEYQITQENLEEGQGILDALAAAPQSTVAAGPMTMGAPAPVHPAVPIPTAPLMATRSFGEGQLVPPLPMAPTAPVSTPDGEGGLVPVDTEGANP